MNNPDVKQVRKYLIGTRFYIKEHQNNFMATSLISISCKQEGTTKKNQIFMFNEKDFNATNLRDRLDEAIMSNEPLFRNNRKDYDELDNILAQMYRDLTIDGVLDN